MMWLILLLILFYITIYYIKEWQIRIKSPPGPWPIPFLGNIIQLGMAADKPHIALHKVAKYYGGDVTRFKFGSKETVLLSSYQSVKDVLCLPDALGRELDGILYDRNNGKNIGLLFSEGEFWEKKRNWVFRKLREFGFGKSHAMESTTNEMVDIFLNDIDKRLSSGLETFEMEESFAHPTFRIMWKMLVGRLTVEDDQITIPRLLKKSHKMANSGSFGAGLITLFPFIKYILPEWSAFNAIMDVTNDSREVAKSLLAEMKMKSKINEEAPTNLTEAYAIKILAEPKSTDFNDEDFEFVFLDLLQAGSDTVSSFLEAVVLFLVLNPEKQTKIYQEIQNSIPGGQRANFIDLKRMNYTQAFMTEVHRCATITHLYIPRQATKDFYYQGYLIKENTSILSDVHGIFNNKKMFGADTELFRPERFIGDDGQLVENYKNVIPFSIGKRMCPGVPYADVVSFLFLVNILRKYELLTVPGKAAPTSKMKVGFGSKPSPFEILIKRREVM